jgi:hypothetical protein
MTIDNDKARKVESTRPYGLSERRTLTTSTKALSKKERGSNGLFRVLGRGRGEMASLDDLTYFIP